MNSIKHLFALVIISFAAMAFMPHPSQKGNKCHVAPTYLDMYYVLGSRFEAITKSDLVKAKTVADFFESEQLQPLLNYEYVEVVLLKQDKPTEKSQLSNHFQLTTAQQNMLREIDYSENFMIRAPFKYLNKETGQEEYFKAEPHFTVVPETQASYSLGEKALIDLIRETNKKNTANVDEDDLQFAKLYFTVEIDGSVSNVYLDRSCGNKKIDEAMKSIIGETSGNWNPASTRDGTRVQQELAITFGTGGC